MAQLGTIFPLQFSPNPYSIDLHELNTFDNLVLVCSLVKGEPCVKHLIEVEPFLEIEEEKTIPSCCLKANLVGINNKSRNYIVSHAYVFCSLRTSVVHFLSSTLDDTNKLHGAPVHSVVTNKHQFMHHISYQPKLTSCQSCLGSPDFGCLWQSSPTCPRQSHSSC